MECLDAEKVGMELDDISVNRAVRDDTDVLIWDEKQQRLISFEEAA